MGIPPAAAELLLLEKRRRPFSGAVLTLGRQDCTFSPENFARLAVRHGVDLSPTSAPNLIRNLGATVTREGMHDRAFFEQLGFERVHSLDASDFEDATLIHDLNQPIPQAFHGEYDLVVNGGTLEHVFDIRTALWNTFRLLKIGGRVVHLAPASNQLDHGFYSFSPTLFYDYFSENRWAIHQSYVFEARDWESPWTVFEYRPGSLDGCVSSFHGIRLSGVTMVGTFFVAEKTAETTPDKTPQQGAYARRWDNAGVASPQEPTGAARAVRDAKRRLDRALLLLYPRKLPPRVGVFGRS